MEFNILDVLFYLIVAFVAIEIINNGDWGGGHRGRLRAVADGCAT